MFKFEYGLLLNFSVVGYFFSLLAPSWKTICVVQCHHNPIPTIEQQQQIIQAFTRWLVIREGKQEGEARHQNLKNAKPPDAC